MTATRTRKAGRRKPSAANDARKAEVEVLAAAIDDEAPDFRLFLARWGDRYGLNNLERLFVQCPRATQLHYLPTWRKSYGRSVKAGSKAIWLRLPHHGQDDSKITDSNPTGETMTGSHWAALFDYSQTVDIDDESATAPADADPVLVAEVKRLRAEAIKIHPDTTGDSSQEAARAFSALWLAYETAKARLDKGTSS